MTAPLLSAGIAGIGFWARGLPSWQAACAYLTGDALPADAPSRPSPQLLAPNERRRAPETVAVALLGMWQEARFSSVAVLSLTLILISVVVVTAVQKIAGSNYLNTTTK